jgi:hypothetical protein
MVQLTNTHTYTLLVERRKNELVCYLIPRQKWFPNFNYYATHVCIFDNLSQWFVQINYVQRTELVKLRQLGALLNMCSNYEDFDFCVSLIKLFSAIYTFYYMHLRMASSLNDCWINMSWVCGVKKLWQRAFLSGFKDATTTKKRRKAIANIIYKYSERYDLTTWKCF